MTRVDTDAAVAAALRLAADQLGLGVFVAQVDVFPPRFVHANEQAARILQRPLDELIGMPPWELLPAEQRPRLIAMIADRIGEAPPIHIQFDVARGDGSLIPVEIGVVRMRTAEGLFALGYFRDQSLQATALEALGRSEARFRQLVEHAPDGVVILREGRIAFMNPEAARLLAVGTPADGIGKELFGLMPPQEARRAGERIARMMRTGEAPIPSEYLSNLDGTERWVEIKSIRIEHEGAPAVLAFARDVTERHRLHHELLRADRLAAVGTLAAAVAHEINNPLTYASLSLQHVARELDRLGAPQFSALAEHVRNARDGTDRVATIIRDLRAFARADDAPPGPVDVAAVVERALKIADNDLRHRARLVRDYGDVPAVSGNASRLEQVFLNLLINAIHALADGQPDRDEVRVAIRTGAPEQVVVEISDTGAGMPAEVAARVFEPFFTTKPLGEGTGLGLSLCKNIVEGQGGRIALESAPGRGTTVRVTLRAHEHAVAAAPNEVTAPASSSEPRLRVLVVDDEKLVRRVLEMVLLEHHDVTSVDGGPAALQALERGFDVILCDLMMPGMTGVDVYQAVRARYPGLERRIVFVTGGAFVPKVADFIAAVDNLKLLKPFDIQQVLRAVRTAAER